MNETERGFTCVSFAQSWKELRRGMICVLGRMGIVELCLSEYGAGSYFSHACSPARRTLSLNSHAQHHAHHLK